ncbi:MAG: Ig-like domain-containing protein [Acidobacteria bacterium]|nr:Ig-like domain-containing protein [Acidobacteriota bacterium]
MARSLPAAFLFLSLFSLHAQTTAIFQNGTGGYLGAKDFSINTQYAQYNGGNGVQWKGTPQLACYTTTGSDPYTVRYLLKFENLNISAGSTVSSASLTLAFESWNSGSGSITGSYLKNAWNPASSRMGWINRNDTAQWAAPGASSPGIDTVAGKSFAVPALRPIGVQSVTIPLDPAAVQSWIDNPANNQGIMLVNNNPGQIIRIVSTTGVQASRPKLTISLGAGTPAVSVNVSPTTATLQPGATQQFTATVTGSTNTAVTWTATGGAINSTGLYTAGTTAGTFTVKATSAADTTKSATAQVTIATTPTVSISIAPTTTTLQPSQTQQFTATVTGSTNTAVAWTATGGAITSTGVYTAGATTGSYAVTATAVTDTTKKATATVNIQSPSTPPSSIPRQSDGAYVVVQTPVSGMRFTAPATVRIFADPYDPEASDPDALTVTFLLNGQSAGTFTGSGTQNGYYAFTATNLAAGTYIITARITSPSKGIVNSAPVTIYVDNPRVTTGPTYNLSSDVVLSGSQVLSYAGTPANHCTIQGNGYQIRSATGFTGSLNITNCDIRNLGTASIPAISVTAAGSGSVQITNNTFDSYGRINLAANDQSQITIRANEFRANTLVAVGSQPANTSTQTIPVISITGTSTAQHYFQGNNIGLSTVVFDRTRNWLIGGSTDADSNILMGVRCGFNITSSSNMVLRGNYSQHNYPHRFSQGQNFELIGDGFLVEHNVIRNSSWAVRGLGGEFRYNLVDQGGNSHAALQAPLSNANIHHNVFLYSVSQTLYAPDSVLSLLYNVDNITFRNNVLDGGGAYMAFYGSPIAVTSGSFIGSLRNNVIFNFASLAGGPALAGPLGESTNPPPARLRYSDYNAFYNPLAPNRTNYGLSVVGKSPGSNGYGLHDLGGFNAQTDPRFAQPTAIPFAFSPDQIWTRTKKVSDVLSSYRARYTPAAGSPLIGAGDPQDGASINIGAVGNGEPADQFGRFLNTTPPPASPVITSFTANPATIQAGQSATLNWSVTGATSLSIAPAPGAVNGTSVSVTPASTTTYTLTATNTAGSVTASTTITVNTTTPSVSVTIAPSTISILTGGTQQFTATVSNASNTAVTWSATGGSITSTGLYTAAATPGAFTVKATSVQDTTKSATAAVTINAVTTTGRPRIILDTPTLSTLRTRAQQNTAEWQALRSVCSSYIGAGQIYFPGENGYPNKPSVGEGYQGSGYIDALMPLGLCYQTTLLSDPTTAAQYGAKGVAILMAMSDPAHEIVNGQPVYNRDYGYGIRNFGVAMGIGYDWFYPLLSSTQKTQLQSALGKWFQAFENDSFEYDHPQGNYFAGYYAAKCMAALAVQGDNPIGDSWWNDWYNNQHLQRVAPYYTANMTGGGWTEGFTQYGILGSRNQALPALAVKTAKGIDIIHATQPYSFPLDQALYLMHFTWPTKDMMDDRGELYNTGDTRIWPGTTNAGIYRFFSGYLTLWNDPNAPMMHRYARDVKTALNALNAGSTEAWLDFLFWDSTAAETSDYSSLPLSYLAPGVGAVAARSDWNPTATYFTFFSAPYINFPSAGHEPFDKGSIAIQRNRNPLVVNPAAWLTHEPNGSAGWTAGFDDRFGNWSADHKLGNRILNNTFQVRHTDASGNILSNYGQWAMQRDDGARTKIARFEDGGNYVLSVGQYLEDMYRPLSSICTGRPPVSSWSRQIVYLRPSQFVVFDRTSVCDASLDQHLAFHFPANLVEAASPGNGARRFDVNPGTFAGSITTILPANAAITTTSQISSNTAIWNKLWRAEIRPTGAPNANRTWLTVFDLAATPGQIASATAVNITAGAATGALLQSAAGNSVVIAGAAPLSYTTPAAQTQHIITDLTPSATYSVNITVAGATHNIAITPGGSLTATANGVLKFNVTSGAGLQAGASLP